ncbi:MAG: hypothetical protein JNN20_12800 [Betaproteobacteria bacterium]|nr:hypothetical protein [Betaproteobacteria bacterium]
MTHDSQSTNQAEAAAAAPVYSLVRTNLPDAREKILELWRDGLIHDGKPEAKLDWYYERNCAGAPEVYFLRKEGVAEPIGVGALGARRMHLGDDVLVNAELVDFIVAREHRKLHPAEFLQTNIGLDTFRVNAIVYGLPNSKSLAVMKRTASWKPVGDIVRRARVLRSASYLSRYLQSGFSRLMGPCFDFFRMLPIFLRTLRYAELKSAWVERPDERFDVLWNSARQPDLIMGVRDSEYLHWRFAECPFESCSFFTIVSHENDRLHAYAVCEIKDRTLQVYDFLIDDKIPGVRDRLWQDLSLSAYRRGCTSISVEFLGPACIQKNLQDAGFVVRDRRPLYAVADEKWHSRFNEESWYVTLADEDG